MTKQSEEFSNWLKQRQQQQQQQRDAEFKALAKEAKKLDKKVGKSHGKLSDRLLNNEATQAIEVQRLRDQIQQAQNQLTEWEL